MKKIKFGILFVLFCALWACADEKPTIKTKRLHFKLPKIVNVPYFEEVMNVDEEGDAFLGFYSFDDAVNLDEEAVFLKKRIENNSSNPVYALVGQNNIPNDGWVEVDSNLLTNLKIVIDDRKAFPYSESALQYRPASDSFLILYVVNENEQKKAVHIADGNLCIALQAENGRKEWQNVITNGCPWCGMSYHWAKLEPKKYMAFQFPKYEGDFKTRLRIRFSNLGQVYYSQPYEGSISSKLLKNKIW